MPRFAPGLTRRSMLKVAAAGALPLTGLGARALRAPGAAARRQAEPTRGGVYRHLGGSDITTLTPGVAGNYEDWWSSGMIVFNQLYGFSTDGSELLPELAADLPQIGEDGLTYTIPLRQGVVFHNGREMTADDVAFTLSWSLWPETASWATGYLPAVVGFDDVVSGKTQALAGVTARDPYTVQIELTQPLSTLPAVLADSAFGISPRQEVIDAGADWGTGVVIGTGPFKLKEFRSGEKVVFERHDRYFKEGLPYLDGLEVYVNVEPNVALVRWESGEAEETTIPGAELPRVVSDPTFAPLIKRTERLQNTILTMYHKAPPFDDVRVRRAVAMAIDRQAFVQITAGVATPLSGLIVPSMPQFDPDFAGPPYDPEGAKALLAEAGYPDGIKGVKIFSEKSQQANMELVASELAKIGIEVEIVMGPEPEYRDRMRNGELQLSFFGWGAGFPDATENIVARLTCRYTEGESASGANYGQYCNETVDDLLAQSNELPIDDPERTAILRQIEDIVINQDVAVVALYSNPAMMLTQPWVHDDPGTVAFAGLPDLERTWLDPR